VHEKTYKSTDNDQLEGDRKPEQSLDVGR